jgi:hypothetical protein
MKKIVAGSIIFLFVLNSYTRILFRDKEKIDKQSKIFFKKIDLQSPDLIKAGYYVESGKYLPAYLCLSEFITKFSFPGKILSRFKEKDLPLLKEFNVHKFSLRIENYDAVRRKLKLSELNFFLLILCSMYDDYSNNILFGKDAFQQWNILLSITETAYKAKNNSPGHTAVLYVFSRFEFFKKCTKWRKKVEANLAKINLKGLVDEEAGFILSELLK